MLRAAVAAAQSERDEMSVLLAQALQVERGRGARGLGGAPLIAAHEMAGELWLQVHRFDEAAAAYRVARGYAADSPRVTAGLARALARQNQVPQACEEYRRLTDQAARAAPGDDGGADRSRPIPAPARVPGARPPLMAYRYQPVILEELARFGVFPTEDTPPSLVHEFINDLYRFELRRLRERLVERRDPEGRLHEPRRRPAPALSAGVHPRVLVAGMPE